MNLVVNRFSGFTKSFFYSLKMSSKVALECIKQNAELAERTIVELKNELESLTTQYNNLQAEQLREENRKLTLAVEEAKKRLIQLEIKNLVKQVPLPNQLASVSVKSDETPPSKVSIEKIEPQEDSVSTKIKKEKKNKEANPKASQSNEPPIDVGRLDFRVAKVEDVKKHPDADTLYVLQINCGESKPRTVCSGLVRDVPIETLREREVVLLCNLKPVKMRGITSEAMVMCACTADNTEVLTPPSGCAPGEPVHCEGYTRNPDSVMNPKKKIFETVVPDLATNDSLQACYKGTPLSVPGKGYVLTATLKNCQVK